MNVNKGAGIVRSILITLAALPVACVGCSKNAAPTAEQPEPRVTVADVVQQEVVDSDDFTGRTEASEIVEVRSRAYGFLKTIDFKDGDIVAEGQTLFTIEPDQYQAIHDQSVARIGLTTANFELAKSKLARDKLLLPNGAISQEQYEESIAAVKSAEASITAAQADANRTAIDLKYTDIKAPISGRIDRALVAKGSLLTGGMTSG